MSNTNKPMTAEDYADRNYVTFKGENFVSVSDFISCMEDYAAQQTAALREEREAVKKERDGLKMQRVKDADDFLTVLQQRDEAVTFLQNLPAAWRNNKVNEFLARLSSGETKPDTGANLASQLKKAMPETYPGKAYQPLFDHMQKQHNHTLLESEMQEIIEIVRKMGSTWISVEDKPAVRGEWSKYDFIVVTPYNYYVGRTRNGEWIDMDNKPIINAKFYMVLPAPPESLTDKKVTI